MKRRSGWANAAEDKRGPSQHLSSDRDPGLQAMACEKQGKTEEALTFLEQALSLARPGGFIFQFLELGSHHEGSAPATRSGILLLNISENSWLLSETMKRWLYLKQLTNTTASPHLQSSTPILGRAPDPSRTRRSGALGAAVPEQGNRRQIVRCT